MRGSTRPTSHTDGGGGSACSAALGSRGSGWSAVGDCGQAHTHGGALETHAFLSVYVRVREEFLALAASHARGKAHVAVLVLSARAQTRAGLSRARTGGQMALRFDGPICTGHDGSVPALALPSMSSSACSPLRASAEDVNGSKERRDAAVDGREAAVDGRDSVGMV